MKEIYFVDSSYSPTAASTNRLFAFGNALIRKGIKVHFFYLFPDKFHSKSDRYEDVFTFHYLWEGSLFTGKYISTILSARKLYRQMKSDVPVYVYASLNCLYFLRQKKGVRLYHEYTENPEIIGKLHGLLGLFLFSLYKKAVKKIDGLFVITPALRDYYIERIGVNPEKIEILNMVVDKTRFEGIYNLAPLKIITYCGIISEYKDGVSILINAFFNISKKYPQYKLQLVGNFENEKTESSIRNLINRLGLNDRVLLPGLISPSKMPYVLKSSEIVVLTRPDNIQAKYGFATKIGEYLMSERPVIMTKVGNVDNYLTDMQDVIFAKPNDVEDFSRKMEWTIDNNCKASIIGCNGKEVALRSFNADIEAEKIFNRIFV